MDKNMICIDNPRNYHNQLQFNLDAQSPVSTASHTYGRPKYLLIEKVQNPAPKQFRVPSLERKFDVVPSDNLTLAIQLAKLDVSNSKWKPEKSSVNLKVQESLKQKNEPKRPKNVDGKHFKEVNVQLPVNNYRAGKISKSAISQQKNSTFRPGTQKPKPRIRFREKEPNFEDHIRRIIEPPGYNRSGRVHSKYSQSAAKDAMTSTADLNREVESFAHRSEFKNFAKELQGVIKKEKLVKRFNQQQPKKSGFLSMQRSPVKRSFRQAMTTPLRASYRPTKTHSHSTSKSAPQRPNLRDAANSPISFNHPKKPSQHKKKVARALNVSTSDSDDQWTSGADTASSEVDTILHGKSKLKHSEKRRHYKKSCENTRTLHENKRAAKDNLVSHILNELFADTAKEVHRNEHDQRELDKRVEDPTFEAIYKKIEQMEREELEIRRRWETIHYDDFAPMDIIKPEVDQTNNTETTSEHRLTSPQPICFTNIDLPSEKENPKPSVRFMQDSQGFHSLYSSPGAKSAASSSQSKSGAKKLTLSSEMADSIMSNRSRHSKYLKHTYHEPKAGFNPWKIVQELSEDVLAQVLQEVAGELENVCDDYVEQIFESEFADPNQTDQSSGTTLVEYSSSFDSYLPPSQEDSSLALSSHISEFSVSTEK